jgi:two-component system, LytTR family, sensor kinase
VLRAQDGTQTAFTAAPGTTPARRRLRFFGFWLAAVLFQGTLLFSYRYLAVLADRGHVQVARPLIDELTAALILGLLFFPVAWLSRTYPLRRDTWRARLYLYALALVLFAATATTSMWLLRAILYPLLAQGRYDYGVIALRYPMEFPMQVLGFTLMVAGVHAYTALRAAHLREVREAHLEASLAQAQLRSLRLQLQPHFLFNALNTISSTMYRDPGAADEMLAQLAELLRASLRTAQTDEVPLHDELDVLDLYVGIMHARFGDALAVVDEIAPDTRDALVPSLLLQPLVENAIRHGNASSLGRGTIHVRARREGLDLLLEVEDDGPGANGRPVAVESGVGLSATAERLRLLYGQRQRFEARDSGRGGFVATVSIPFHEVATDARADR